MALCALVHAFDPSMVDYNQLDPSRHHDNLELVYGALPPLGCRLCVPCLSACRSMCMCLCVCLVACVFVGLSGCLYLVSVSVSLAPFVHLSVKGLPACQSVWLPVCLCCLSVCRSVGLVASKLQRGAGYGAGRAVPRCTAYVRAG